MKVVAAVTIALVFLTGVASAFTYTHMRHVGDWKNGDHRIMVVDDVTHGVVCYMTVGDYRYSQSDTISCVKVTPP